MAPFRAAGRSNRSGRVQIDHDVFEGLPVRQWRRQECIFGQPAPTDPVINSKGSLPELPMPKDSHMLPAWSQNLLRLARAGKLYKTTVPQGTEEEREIVDEEAEEAVKVANVQKGFSAKRWAHVPPHLEEPEPQYLAKRRKGLPPLVTSRPLAGGVVGSEVKFRETKVQKVDDAGHVNVYTVLVPEGQTVEGEIVEAASAVTNVPAVAPGTVIQGVGVVNEKGVVVAAGAEFVQPTPPRRRPPPPRRKPKKGRTRKIQPPAGATGVPSVGSIGSVGSVTADNTTQPAAPGIPAIKTEHVEDGSQTTMQYSTEIVKGQEGDEDRDEEGEEEEEGEVGEEDDREEGELSPSPEPQRRASGSVGQVNASSGSNLTSIAPAKTQPVPPPPRAVSSSPDLPLASAPGNATQPDPSEEPPPLDLSEVPPPLDLPETRASADDAELKIGFTEGNELDADVIEPETIEAQDTNVHFEDGEVDLFGSLERHLDQQDSRLGSSS